jgi:prepilin-type N-terminal cleavage/methylation domain-containing protein
MHSLKKVGFTLTEVMIVVAIVGILSVIATPYYFKARERSHRSTCLENMKKIQGAKELYAINSGTKTALSWTDILPYLQRLPSCPSGGEYMGWNINEQIYCTLHDWRGNSDYVGFSP